MRKYWFTEAQKSGHMGNYRSKITTTFQEDLNQDNLTLKFSITGPRKYPGDILTKWNDLLNESEFAKYYSLYKIYPRLQKYFRILRIWILTNKYFE